MRTLIILALFASFQVIRAEDKPVNTTTTDGGGETNRPRTVKQAKSQSRLKGVKMEQSEKAKRMALTSLPDEKEKPFAPYNLIIIDAVQNRWHQLFDAQRSAPNLTGRVVLQFKLHQDGRVTEMKVLESTVGESLSLFCQKAVLDLSPFARWPAEMRKQIAADSRTVTLIFKYLADEPRRRD